MNPSSRTPEGRRNECPYCGSKVCIDPSTFPITDAPCPVCGQLLWFDSDAPTTATSVARIRFNQQAAGSEQKAPLQGDLRTDPIPEEPLVRRLAKIEINLSTPAPITVFVLVLAGIGVFELLLWSLFGEQPQWSRRGVMGCCLLAFLCCGFAEAHRRDAAHWRWHRFAGHISLMFASLVALWFLYWAMNLGEDTSVGRYVLVVPSVGRIALMVLIAFVVAMFTMVTSLGVLAVVHQAVSCVLGNVRITSRAAT